MANPGSGKDKHPQDDPAQSKRFIDTAKEIEADETEAGADKAFKRAVQQQPQGSKRRT